MLITELETIMENFYLCSHLPLWALNYDHTLLLDIGHTTSHKLEHFFTKEQLASLFEAFNTMPLVHRLLDNDKNFTLCPIDPKNLSKGYFIIGPYTTQRELKETLPFKPLHCMVHIIHMLYAIGDSFCETKEEEYNYHVNKAKTYINAHYAEPITLESLAHHLGLHKSYFCTIFKKATKQSFCSYTNLVRVEKSKALLKNSTDTILEIALATGFSGASYFNTTFKKLVGMTPLEYRNQHN